MPVQPQQDSKPDELVQSFSKKLKCTSWILVIWGVVGVAMAVFHGFNARHEAYDIIHRPHHGGSPPSPSDFRHKEIDGSEPVS
jgi:hypothetical protein